MAIDLTSLADGASGWGASVRAILTKLDTDKASAAEVAAGFTPSTKAGADNARALADVAYRAWYGQLTTATVPRVLIAGHSVPANGGASDAAHGFPALLTNLLLTVNPAVVVSTDAVGGRTSADLLAATNALPKASATGLVIMMCLLNDFFYNVPSATSRANLVAIIARYRAAETAPGPSFVIVTEWLRSDTPTPLEPWSAYVAAARSIADADPTVTVVDLGARLGDVAGNAYGVFADAAHPNDRGHAIVADVLGRELTRMLTPVQFAPHTVLTAGLAPLANTNWSSLVVITDWTMSLESTGAQNASVTFGFLGAAGHYAITLQHRVAPNRGAYSIYIDGVLAGSGGSFDGYNAAASNVTATVTGFAVTTSGLHTIELRMATKNGSSSSYVASVHRLMLTRTGA
jgi:hypothetical protein